MRYTRIVWHHDFVEEPTVYYAEVGDDGWEIRRVQEYRDGHLEWADQAHETARAGLSEVAIDIDEINSQPDVELTFIDKVNFESVWKKAQG